MLTIALGYLALLGLVPLLLGLTHGFTCNWNRNSDQIAVNVTITNGAEENLDEVVPHGSNGTWTYNMVVAKLKSLYMISDQPVTVITNPAHNAGAGDDSFTLAANVPLIWFTGSPLPNPLASGVTVTQLKATCPGGTDANLKVRAIYDPS